MWNLFTTLWQDENGSVLATEYLMLGTIVTIGTATGLAAVRDSLNDEYAEFGNQVRQVRQTYSVPARKGAAGSTGGTRVTDAGNASPSAADVLSAVPPTLNGQQIHFSAPNP